MSFIPLKPIPIKDRVSMVFISKGQIDVRDGAFVVMDEVKGDRKHIPVGHLHFAEVRRDLRHADTRPHERCVHTAQPQNLESIIHCSGQILDLSPSPLPRLGMPICVM